MPYLFVILLIFFLIMILLVGSALIRYDYMDFKTWRCVQSVRGGEYAKIGGNVFGAWGIKNFRRFRMFY